MQIHFWIKEKVKKLKEKVKRKRVLAHAPAVALFLVALSRITFINIFILIKGIYKRSEKNKQALHFNSNNILGVANLNHNRMCLILR